MIPRARYTQDVEMLHALAEWLEEQVADVPNDSVRHDFVSLDYFRLSARLQQMAKDAAEFAQIYAGRIP